MKSNTHVCNLKSARNPDCELGNRPLRLITSVKQIRNSFSLILMSKLTFVHKISKSYSVPLIETFLEKILDIFPKNTTIDFFSPMQNPQETL